MLFKCTISGRCAVKKNNKRVFKRHGRTIVLSSEKVLAWERLALPLIIRAKTRPMIDFPVEARFKFYFKNRQHEPDVSNLTEAPQDLLQKAGVIQNDKLIVRIVAEKFFGEEPRTEIELWPYEAA